MTLASPGVDALEMVNSAGLRLQIYLLSPAALGVETWELGDAAVYEYRSIGSKSRSSRAIEGPADPGLESIVRRDVRVAVVGLAGPDDELVARGFGTPGNHWLRLTGLDLFRGEPYDRFALVRPDDLRLSRKAPIYSLQAGYFPQMSRALDLSTTDQAILRPLGSEDLETKAGRFSCDRYEGAIGDASIEIWSSPEARPLGIVRIRSGSEEMVLAGVDHGPAPIEVDPVIEPLVQGLSTFALGCLSCHFDPLDPSAVLEPPR